MGQLLEAVHPSGTYIGPARISMVINQSYFLVEQIDTSQVKGATRCYYSQEPTLLPVGWCVKNGVTLGKPEGRGCLYFVVTGISNVMLMCLTFLFIS